MLGENLFVMLLVEAFFQTFTSKTVADASTTTEVIVCLGCDRRAQIEALVVKAVAHGATRPRPAQDHGFMYQDAYTDLDGHIWELVYLSGAPPVVTAG